jgi:hypothetical protein
MTIDESARGGDVMRALYECPEGCCDGDGGDCCRS